MPNRRPKNTETAIQAYCRINRDMAHYSGQLKNIADSLLCRDEYAS